MPRPDGLQLPARRWREGFRSETTYCAAVQRAGQTEASVRPVRWVMLLIVLMALVVLIVSRPGLPQQRSRGHAMPRASVPDRASRTAGLPSPSLTAPSSPTTEPSTVAHHDAAAASAGPLSLVTSSPGPSDTTTTTAAPTFTPTQATAAPVTTFNGWLSGPTSVSASYPVSPVSPTRASATWNTSTSLTLAADCGGTTTSSSGSSGVSVTLPSGGCTITISGPDDVATTSFSISVGAS